MSHLSGKDTAEGVESTLVLCWDELGHIQHEWAVWVAVPDGTGVDVIQRSLIQIVHSVLLSLGRRRQMPDHHLQQCLWQIPYQYRTRSFE